MDFTVSSDADLQNALQWLHKSSNVIAAFRAELNSNPRMLGIIDKQGRNLLDIALTIGLNNNSISEILRAKKSLARGHGNYRPAFCRILDKRFLDAEDITTCVMLLEHHTDVAHEFDEGVLPLHKLLDRPPESFIPQMEKLMERLLLVYNHAAYVPIGGVLPLHMALHRGMSEEGISALLRSNPEAGGHKHPGGHYPLFIALQQRLGLDVIKTLIEYYPAALCEVVKDLNVTPLEYAAKIKLEPSVLKALVIGGSGKVAKCSAYALAAMDAMMKRTSFPKPKSLQEVEEELENAMVRGFSASTAARAAGMWKEAMINDEGLPVTQGKGDDGEGKFYCGKPLGREATEDYEHCGPDDGPQCSSCKRFQDRYLNLQVKPFHGRCFMVSISKKALVEDLHELLSLMEGTEQSRQKLLDSSGHRLRAGDRIGEAITQHGIAPQSARHAAKKRIAEAARTTRESRIAIPKVDVSMTPMAASFGDREFAAERPTIFMVPKMDILFIVVRNGCPVDIIDAILTMRPALAEEQDEHGQLPLHLALAADPIDESVVLSLHATYQGACRVRSGPELHHPYPIETAVYRGCSSNVIEAFAHRVEDDDWTEHGYFDPLCKNEDVKLSHSPLMFEVLKAEVDKGVFEIFVEKEYPLDQVDPTTGLTLLEMSVSENSEEALFNYLFDTIMNRVGKEELMRGPKGGTLLHTACLTQTPDYIISEICERSRSSETSLSEGMGILTLENSDGELPLHCGCATQLPRDSAREILLRYLPEASASIRNWEKGAAHRTHDHLAIQGYCRHTPPPTLAEWPTARTGLLPIQIAVQSRAVDGFVFELARIAPRTLDVKDARGNTLLDLAAKSDAPSHIVYELLEIRPELIEHVKVFDSRFPNNPCAAEIRRLALTPPKPISPFRAMMESSTEKYTPAIEDNEPRRKHLPKKQPTKAATPTKDRDDHGGFFSWLWH